MWWQTVVAALAAMLSLAGMQPSPSQAAEYNQEELNKLYQKFRSKWGPLQTKGKIEGAEDKEIFDAFVAYRIAELTWPEMLTLKGKPLEKLSIRRDRVKTVLGNLSRSQAPDLHRQLNETLLERLSAQARDQSNGIPARVNCLLMIGMLDETEQSAGQPAVPLPGALRIVLETAGNADEHAALRIAALVGLERHIAAGGNAEVGRVVTPTLVKVVRSKKPAANQGADGHLWLRWKAVNVIDRAAKNGVAEANTPEVAATLIDVASESGADRWLRVEAAGALGSLDSKAIPAAATSKLTETLGRLAVDATIRHADLIKRTIPAPPPTDELQIGVNESNDDESDDEESDEETTESEADAPQAVPGEARGIVARDAVDELIKIRLGLVGVSSAPKKRASRKKEEEKQQPSKAELVGPVTDRGIYAAAGDDSTKEFVLDVVLRIDEVIDKLLNNKDDDAVFAQLLETAGDGLKGLLDGRKVADEPTKAEGDAKESKARPVASGPRGGVGASESTVSP